MPVSLSLQVLGLDVSYEGTLGSVVGVILGEMKIGCCTSSSPWFHRGCVKGTVAP